MGLRAKILLAFLVFLLALIPLVYLVASRTVLQGFLDVEAQHSSESARRVESAFRNMVEELNTKVSDWSQWDDTYAFVQDGNEEYVDSNLSQQSLDLLKIDAILFFDENGELVFGRRIVEGAIADNPMPEGLESVLRQQGAIVRFDDPMDSRSGVLGLSSGRVLFAIRPIVTSEGAGPIRGSVMFIRSIDAGLERNFSLLMRFDIAFIPFSGEPSSPEEEVVQRKLLGGEGIVLDANLSDPDILRCYVLVRDVFGEPQFMMRVSIPRLIYQEGLRNILIFTGFGGILGGIFLGAILVLLEKFVLSRISRLHEAVESIRVRGIGSVDKVRLPGRDEFASFASTLNNLLAAVRFSERSLRSQAEELRKFALAVEYNFDQIVITDPDGKILYANPSLKRTTGFDPEEVIGKTPALWGKQMGPRFYREFWKRIKEDKEPFIGEFTNKKKTGETYLAEARVVPILDDRQNIRFLVGIERDITKQREHERGLIRHNQLIAEEKDRTESILRFLRSIGDGIFAVDKNRKIIFMNDAAERLTGKKYVEIRGLEPKETLPFFLDTDPPTVCPCPLEQVLIRGRETLFPNDVFLLAEDGRKMHVSGQASPIVDKDGAVTGAIVVFRDITKKREMEQMKDRFLSVAAHQLRTPLGSMRWNMEMILSGDFGKLPKKVALAVRDLFENSQRLVTIVNDLLDVSRINAHRTKEMVEPTDVPKVIRDVIKMVSHDAKRTGVSIVFPEVHLGRKPVLSPKRLYEVVENLLTNAIKYSHKDDLVTISVVEEEDVLSIRVSDSGIGIPEGSKERIFSKFFRAENAVHKETDGSGLGLSVVKSYVEEDGGIVRFESEEGVGTTFIVRYPFQTQ